MGGRGSQSSLAGQNNQPRRDTITQLTAQDGTTIDLTDYPLEYGAQEILSNAERATVDRLEKKRYTAKVEYGALVNVNGLIITEKRGGRNSVSLPGYLYNRASIFTHNHPRSGKEVGMLGGTFSDADLRGFANTPVYTYRATALEGTYSITKVPGRFDADGMKNFVRQVYTARRAQYNTATTALDSQAYAIKAKYIAGAITQAAASAAIKKINAAKIKEGNRMMVNIHNDLLAGQNAHGYTYTLERRT